MAPASPPSTRQPFTERATSFELTPPDAAEMARRVTTLLARTPWLVAEEDGRWWATPTPVPIAIAPRISGRSRSRPTSTKRRQRAGQGRALYAALFRILVAQGFVNAYAGITLPNPASVGFHRAMGFKKVGVYEGIGYKFGRWHDVVWLHRPLAPRLARR